MLEIKELIEKKAYNDALAIVNRQIGDGLSNPFLWNVRGDLIQLADENCTFSLRDAEMSYHKALEIDPRDLRALAGHGKSR